MWITGVHRDRGAGNGENAYMIPDKDDFYRVANNYPNHDVKIVSEKMPFDDLCKLFLQADKVLCQQGWGTALAEGLNVPCDVVFTHRAKNGNYDFVKQITPQKVFTKQTSKAVYVP